MQRLINSWPVLAGSYPLQPLSAASQVCLHNPVMQQGIALAEPLQRGILGPANAGQSQEEARVLVTSWAETCRSRNRARSTVLCGFEFLPILGEAAHA